MKSLALPTENLKERLKVALRTAFDMHNGIKAITVSDHEMSQISGYLHHEPQNWLYIHPNHPFYGSLMTDIREFLGEIPENAFILIHSNLRYCLMCHHDMVAPFVFKQDFERGIRFYRVVSGEGVRWLGTMRLDVQRILAEQLYLNKNDHADIKEMPVHPSEKTMSYTAQDRELAAKTGSGLRL